MADHISIDGVPAYNGDYDLDLTAFKNRELRTIKKISGVRAGELPAALEAGDTDLIVAFAVIALERSGIADVNVDAIWEAETGKITFVSDDDEETGDTERPPDEAL